MSQATRRGVCEEGARRREGRGIKRGEERAQGLGEVLITLLEDPFAVTGGVEEGQKAGRRGGRGTSALFWATVAAKPPLSSPRQLQVWSTHDLDPEQSSRRPHSSFRAWQREFLLTCFARSFFLLSHLEKQKHQVLHKYYINPSRPPCVCVWIDKFKRPPPSSDPSDRRSSITLHLPGPPTPPSRHPSSPALHPIPRHRVLWEPRRIAHQGRDVRRLGVVAVRLAREVLVRLVPERGVLRVVVRRAGAGLVERG